MPEIRITFNGTADELDDFAAEYGYPETVTDAEGNRVANPETKQAFFKRKVREFVQESVKRYRANTAARNARQAELSKSVSF